MGIPKRIIYLTFCSGSPTICCMLSRSDALKTLQPHQETLKKCLFDGWQAYHTHYQHRHHVLDARARAAIVYCEIIYRAKELFTNPELVKIVKRRWMYVLYFGHEIALRFKKLRNGKPSNVKTGQQVLFNLQRPIPSILPSTYLTAGYELDPLQQAIAQSLVIARLDGHQVWSIDLNLGEDEGSIAFMPTQPEQPRKPSRVRAKTKAKKQKDSTENIE